MLVYVAGINGMVGSAVATELRNAGHLVIGKTSHELDLTNRLEVLKALSECKPDSLVIAAAKVGGIAANMKAPVDFLSTNLQIQTNLLDAAHKAEISKVLFLGSSCIYPKSAKQPIQETELLNGPLEPTNESYAIAKIAGIKLIQAYRSQFGHNWISAMPTNLYGPNDNFNVNTAHVLPALIHRFHLAKIHKQPSIKVWGDGSALREFLHVSDLARAISRLLASYNDALPINIGSGHEISIKHLAGLISKNTGYTGEIELDESQPNGVPRKLLDSSLINNLGWSPTIDLDHGISSTYSWFLENYLPRGEK